MGYEVHITRNEEWWDEDAGGGDYFLYGSFGAFVRILLRR